MIKTQNLSKKFHRIEAVRDLNLDVREGEIFGLIGPNGAGKTTTARLLSGIVKASAGEGYIGGYSIRSQMAKVREILGIVPEGTPLYRRLTAVETIRFFGKIHGVTGDRLEERVASLARDLGLEDHLARPNEGLSLGTKKKVLFAAALLHEPQVLICDEPTLALDPRAARSIAQLLELFRERRRTVIVTSHNMEMIDRLCDRIGIIHQGQIRIVGPPEEIKRELATTLRRQDVVLDDVFLHYTAA